MIVRVGLSFVEDFQRLGVFEAHGLYLACRPISSFCQRFFTLRGFGKQRAMFPE